LELSRLGGRLENPRRNTYFRRWSAEEQSSRDKARMNTRATWRNWAIALTLGVCPLIHAAPSKTNGKEKNGDKTDEPAARPVPFHGKVISVDNATKTFTLNGKGRERLFRTNEQTEFWKDGKQTDFRAITAGENVRGSAVKNDAEWEVKKVTIGAKEEPEPEKRK
jgi:hypothetical protein